MSHPITRSGERSHWDQCLSHGATGRAVVCTWSGPLSNIFRVRGNWWEWGVYCTPTGPVAPGRLGGRSRLTGCLVTSLVRLELLALDVGGDPLPSGEEATLFYPEPAALEPNTGGSSQVGSSPSCGPWTKVLSSEHPPPQACHRDFQTPAAGAGL